MTTTRFIFYELLKYVDLRGWNIRMCQLVSISLLFTLRLLEQCEQIGLVYLLKWKMQAAARYQAQWSRKTKVWKRSWYWTLYTTSQKEKRLSLCCHPCISLKISLEEKKKLKAERYSVLWQNEGWCWRDVDMSGTYITRVKTRKWTLNMLSYVLNTVKTNSLSNTLERVLNDNYKADTHDFIWKFAEALGYPGKSISMLTHTHEPHDTILFLSRPVMGSSVEPHTLS